MFENPRQTHCIRMQWLKLVLADLLRGRFKTVVVGTYYVVKTWWVCRRMHRALMALPIHKRRFAVAELQRIMEER